jgi:HAD superfamily hydrolase (TIGR01509 family)
MIEAVIFDMDGVIVESEKIKHEAGKRSLKKFGVEDYSKEVYQERIGLSAVEFWSSIRKQFGLEATVQELRKPWFEEYIPLLKTLPLKDGVDDLVLKLKAKGIKVALASSSDRKQISIVIGKFKEDNFQAVMSGDDVEKAKPDPEIFLKAAQKLNVQPEKCLVIEDSFHGVTAAKRAGMKCVAIATEYTKHMDLSHADYHINAHKEFDLKFLEE